ncbi:macro domain-containing protein [Candidatus Woesearchaeota archaeon]|nr:macro domain-containing protein [Candidatus Woesearchaeota archaeon]
MKQSYTVGHGIVEICSGSITSHRADALVCPATTDLDPFFLAGTIQYAFRKDGGADIFDELKRYKDCLPPHNPPFVAPSCSAHLTGAGNLSAKHVIHVISIDYDPARGDCEEDHYFSSHEVIARTTANALKLAKKHRLQSVGFPLLGTGLYEVPLEEAVEAMTHEYAKHLHQKTSVTRIGLIFFTREAYSTGKRVCNDRFTSH